MWEIKGNIRFFAVACDMHSLFCAVGTLLCLANCAERQKVKCVQKSVVVSVTLQYSQTCVVLTYVSDQ